MKIENFYLKYSLFFHFSAPDGSTICSTLATHLFILSRMNPWNRKLAFCRSDVLSFAGCWQKFQSSRIWCHLCSIKVRRLRKTLLPPHLGYSKERKTSQKKKSNRRWRLRSLFCHSSPPHFMCVYLTTLYQLLNELMQNIQRRCEVLGEDPVHWHCVHNKFHTDRPAIEPGPSRWAYTFKLPRRWRQHAPPKRTAIYQTTGRPKTAAFNIRYLQELTQRNEERHTFFINES
jgi:hypothetical protein